MNLTGITDSMVEAAMRRQSLCRQLNGPPKKAIIEIAKALFEHSIAEMDHAAIPQEWWDRLPIGSKQMELDNATWLIGRLALAGYIVAKG